MFTARPFFFKLISLQYIIHCLPRQIGTVSRCMHPVKPPAANTPLSVRHRVIGQLRKRIPTICQYIFNTGKRLPAHFFMSQTDSRHQHGNRHGKPVRPGKGTQFIISITSVRLLKDKTGIHFFLFQPCTSADCTGYFRHTLFQAAPFTGLLMVLCVNLTDCFMDSRFILCRIRKNIYGKLHRFTCLQPEAVIPHFIPILYLMGLNKEPGSIFITKCIANAAGTVLFFTSQTAGITGVLTELCLFRFLFPDLLFSVFYNPIGSDGKPRHSAAVKKKCHRSRKPVTPHHPPGGRRSLQPSFPHAWIFTGNILRAVPSVRSVHKTRQEKGRIPFFRQQFCQNHTFPRLLCLILNSDFYLVGRLRIPFSACLLPLRT